MCVTNFPNAMEMEMEMKMDKGSRWQREQESGTTISGNSHSPAMLIRVSTFSLSLSFPLSGQQVQSVHRTKEVACAGRTRLSYLALIYYSIFNVFTNTSQAQGQAPGQDSACSGLPDYLLESTSGTVKRVAHSRRSVQFRVIDPRRLHLAVDSFPCVVTAVSGLPAGTVTVSLFPFFQNDSPRTQH